MSSFSAGKPLCWPELAVVAILGALIVMGLAAEGRSVGEGLVAIAFGAALLAAAWAWQRTRRRAVPWQDLTGRERAWSLIVFGAWLAPVAALVWWSVALKRG